MHIVPRGIAQRNATQRTPRDVQHSALGGRYWTTSPPISESAPWEVASPTVTLAAGSKTSLGAKGKLVKK